MAVEIISCLSGLEMKTIENDGQHFKRPSVIKFNSLMNELR